MRLDFGGKLRRFRKQMGLTQQQFAGKTGLSVNSVRRYESGEWEPPVAVVGQIAGAFQMEPTRLFAEMLAAEDREGRMQDTIQFFEKLAYKAERSLSAALFRGDRDAAENIRKKIIHYRRALAALDPARDGRDCTNCRFLAAEDTASGKRYCTHTIDGPYACSHWKEADSDAGVH